MAYKRSTTGSHHSSRPKHCAGDLLIHVTSQQELSSPSRLSKNGNTHDTPRMPSPYLPNNVHDQGWIDWRLLSEMLGSRTIRTSSMAEGDFCGDSL